MSSGRPTVLPEVSTQYIVDFFQFIRFFLPHSLFSFSPGLELFLAVFLGRFQFVQLHLTAVDFFLELSEGKAVITVQIWTLVGSK